MTREKMMSKYRCPECKSEAKHQALLIQAVFRKGFVIVPILCKDCGHRVNLSLTNGEYNQLLDNAPYGMESVVKIN